MNPITLFHITWHYHVNNETLTIGFLSYDADNKQWEFKYNLGEIARAVSYGFMGFPEFSNLEEEYNSPQLFRTFKARISGETRKDILTKYNMEEYNELELLKVIPYLFTDNIGVIYQKPLDWTK